METFSIQVKPCKEKLDSMAFNSDGFYCHLCTKQVVDCSKKSLYQVEKSIQNIECGIFKAEQIEPDLIPLVVPKGIKQFLWSFVTILGLSVSKLNAQSTKSQLKTISIDTSYSSTDSTFIIEKTEIEVDTIIPKNNPEKTKTCNSKNDLRRFRHRHRMFVSSRFPFVHLRRHHIYGFVIPKDSKYMGVKPYKH